METRKEDEETGRRKGRAKEGRNRLISLLWYLPGVLYEKEWIRVYGKPTTPVVRADGDGWDQPLGRCLSPAVTIGIVV
jgi:hypothetical protein